MEIILKNLARKYTESPQINPLRWVCLHQIGQETFENTTSIFKCKDYFNDFVAYKHSKNVFRMYGMNSDDAKFDAHGGLSMLVFNITPHFEGNLKRVLEPVFGKLWDAHVSFRLLSPSELSGECNKITGNCGILWLSPECFTTTFHISAITLFIRACNSQVLIEDFDSCCHRATARQNSWRPNIRNMFLKREIVFEELALDWCFFGDGTKKYKTSGDFVHNNGVNGWCDYLHKADSVDIWLWYSSLPTLNEGDHNDEVVEEEEEQDEWDDAEDPVLIEDEE